MGQLQHVGEGDGEHIGVEYARRPLEDSPFEVEVS